MCQHTNASRYLDILIQLCYKYLCLLTDLLLKLGFNYLEEKIMSYSFSKTLEGKSFEEAIARK